MVRNKITLKNMYLMQTYLDAVKRNKILNENEKYQIQHAGYI